MKLKIFFLSFAITLLGISISQIVALDEIEDCPLGSSAPNCAAKQAIVQPLKPGCAA
jgi:hypothetical protein